MADTFDTLATARELENEGMARAQAEAVARAIRAGQSDLVTGDRLDATLAKQSEQLTVRMATIVAIGCAVLFAALRYLPAT